MTIFQRLAIGALLGLGSLTAHGQACDTTLSPGQDLTKAVEAATTGDVICLNAGTYTRTQPTGGAYPATNFGIARNVVIRGLGTTPAQTILRSSAADDYAVKFLRYPLPPAGIEIGNPSGARLENVTIDTAHGGVQVLDFAVAPNVRLTDITLKDVVINTPNAGVSFGVKLQNADRIVLDNVTITSYQAGIYFVNVTDSLVMNSSVRSTLAEGAVGLAVLDGNGNRFVNNTIGQPKTGSTYSFNTGGVVFYNTSDNRFENNTIQGMRDDGLDFTVTDLSANSLPTIPSQNNYVGKNNIISTGFADGLSGGSGIWSNCASTATWLYANDSQGSVECGICVWLSRNNMVLANRNHNNGLVGIAVSGGSETKEFCEINAGAFQQKPQSTFVMSNYNYFNRADQLVVRNSDTTDIVRNFAYPRDGFGGPLQVCTNAEFCQSAYALETDATGTNSNGFRVLANTNVSNFRNLQSDDGKTTGIEYYLNRTISSPTSRWTVATPQNIDRGPTVGGNFWSQWVATGNPSSTTPYTGVFDSPSNTTGKITDRFPYQTEDFGRGYNVTVFEPRAGFSFAQGTRRTVRWDSVGCTWVDISLDGTTDLLTNAPNTGYAVVTIPGSAAIGNHTIVVKCKNSAGTVRSQASSPTFAVSSSALQLMSPGRDDVLDAGSAIWVGWKKSSAIATVDIEFSTNGTTWTSLATGLTGTAARVTLPAIASNAYARIRVKSGTTIDMTDGVFAVRGASGAGFSNIAAGRRFLMGQMERLEWASPQNSRLVTINATVGAITKNVATDLPDRGSYDWVVPDFPAAGTLSLSITFKQINGTTIGAPATNASGSTIFPTTITFGAAPTLAPGQTRTVTAVTNSGAAATFAASPSSVCTMSGSSVTGVANGTCTITANAVATGSFAAALPVTLVFSVGQSQTITFTAPPQVVVGGTVSLTATASSGLPVTYTSLTEGICSVSGSVVSGLNVGTCTIAADQAGNTTFAAAQRVTRSFPSIAGGNIARLANISTRMQVLTNNDVLIGGFVIGGSGTKQVVIRARGPSLLPFGITNALMDPAIQVVRSADQVTIATNDDWQTQSAANVTAIQASGFAPGETKEAALILSLGPGAYTAIVSGVGGTTGVGIVEVFEVDHPEIPLVNISTRGQVLASNADVMIGGFVIQGATSKSVVVRARGPSLIPFGITNALLNPTLELVRSSDGQTLVFNDDWQTQDAAAVTAITASGFAPSEERESAILITLPPGAYTAIVRGLGATTGVGIVEVFAQ